MCDLLFGRRLLTIEMQQMGFTETQLAQFSATPAMQLKGTRIHCQRCQSSYVSEKVQLPQGQYYCPSCIQLNRVTSDQYLYHLPEPNHFQQQTQPLTWQGTLTAAQAKIAQELIYKFQKRQPHLLWAVTGAGKTEMLFPLLATAIQKNCRIGVVSPRVDVCNELYPRLTQAFAHTTQQLLHGQQTVPYQYTQLTVATTHQLLRFYHAFDLLIVDEVDAFPYVNSALLKSATTQAIKPKGSLFYLTATPTPALHRSIEQQKLSVSYLPRRFHGRPLPLPKLIYQRKLTEKFEKQPLIQKFQQYLTVSLNAKRQVLIFLPKISWLMPMANALEKQYAQAIGTVHANDDQRQEKVQQFRTRQLDILLTTTILERGVTFSNIDVYVLKADDWTFTTASLVQIAGRAGRDANYPNGAVYFFYEHYNCRIRDCQRQIKYMNAKEVIK